MTVCCYFDKFSQIIYADLISVVFDEGSLPSMQIALYFAWAPFIYILSYIKVHVSYQLK